MFEGFSEEQQQPVREPSPPASVSKRYKLLFVVVLSTIFLLWRFLRQVHSPLS